MCRDKVRFAGKEKFPTKVVVWIAISAQGLSKPLTRPLKYEAINSCINEHHPNLNYMFWSESASSRYTKAAVGWMDQNLKCAPKNINPPNVPYTDNQKLVCLVERPGCHKRAAVDPPRPVQDKRIQFEKCGEARGKGQEQININWRSWTWKKWKIS